MFVAETCIGVPFAKRKGIFPESGHIPFLNLVFGGLDYVLFIFIAPVCFGIGIFRPEVQAAFPEGVRQHQLSSIELPAHHGGGSDSLVFKFFACLPHSAFFGVLREHVGTVEVHAHLSHLPDVVDIRLVAWAGKIFILPVLADVS